MTVRPVAVVGMHRSGTTLVAKIVHAMGVNMGQDLEKNAESRFFLGANEWLFRFAGATWDRPENIRHLLASDQTRRAVCDHLGYLIRSPYAARHMGLGRYVRYRTMRSVGLPWGWKDPRNTFTLPFWQEFFDIRVVNVARHGVDVAHSLLRRHEFMVEKIAAMGPIARLRYWRSRNSIGELRSTLGISMRCATPQGGMELWKEYVDEGARMVGQLGCDAITIRYEDLLREPRKVLPGLAAFLGVRMRRKVLASIEEQLQPSRVFAYRHDPRLIELAESWRTELAQHGYVP